MRKSQFSCFQQGYYTGDTKAQSFSLRTSYSMDICWQVPLLTARSRLDMGEEKIANEIDEYFRCSLVSSYWDKTLITKFLFRDQLIYKRNKRMGARVIELLLNNPGQFAFFLFCTFIETYSFLIFAFWSIIIQASRSSLPLVLATLSGITQSLKWSGKLASK